MSLPAAVQTLFDVHQIPFDLVPREVPQACTVRTVLLGDKLGRLQLILPAWAMADLELLERATGRHFVALKPSEASELCQRLGLNQPAAIPQLDGLHTLVDLRLYTYSDLLLDVGTGAGLLRVDQDQFRQLARSAEAGDFARDTRAYPIRLDDEAAIRKAVSEFMHRRVQERLEETLEIPPLPGTAREILRLRMNPDAGIPELASIIESDPVLTAQVLCWASAPYYGGSGHVASISDAIMRVLGFDLVLNMALGLALSRTLPMPAAGAQGITPYWQQAVFAATAMQGLIRLIPRTHRPSGNLGYLAGMLHNFGLPVLAQVFRPHYERVTRHLEANRHLDHSAVEATLLGVTREQIAAWLLDCWALPAETTVAIRHQFDPRYDGAHATYANLLYLTLQLLREQGIGDGPALAIPDALTERLHLDLTQARDVVAQLIEERRDELAAMADSLAH